MIEEGGDISELDIRVDERLSDASRQNEGSAAAFALLVMDHVTGQPLSHALQPDLGER